MNQGPTITLNLSCSNCAYCKEEHYRVQSDSGFDITCTHESRLGIKSYIGDSAWKTPQWCPLLLQAFNQAHKEIDSKIEQIKAVKP